MSAGDIYGILPVKSLGRAKRRLAGCLSPAGRRQLMLALYMTGLDALTAALPAMQVAVVSHDETVLDVARRRGAYALPQAGYGLNAALEEGRAWALGQGARAVLALLADLPLVSGVELQAMIERSAGGREAILAPGQRGGTHALLLRPADWLAFAFGPNSFARYAARVRAAGGRLVVYASQALAFDIDLPEDWIEAQRLRPALTHMVLDATDRDLRHPWPARSAARR